MNRPKLYTNINYDDIKNENEKIYTNTPNEMTPNGFNNNKKLQNPKLPNKNKYNNDEDDKYHFSKKFDTPDDFNKNKKLQNVPIKKNRENEDEINLKNKKYDTPADFNKNNKLQNVPLNKNNKDEDDYHFSKKFETPADFYEKKKLKNDPIKKNNNENDENEINMKNKKYDTPAGFNKNNKLQNVPLNKNKYNNENEDFFETRSDFYENKKINNVQLNQIKNDNKKNIFFDNKYKSQLNINDENFNKINQKIIDSSEKVNLNDVKKMQINLLDITSGIFWIDEKINKKENKNYIKIFEIYFQKNVNAFDNLNDAFYLIKKYKFTYIYILISGKLYQEYLNMLQKEINNIYCIPITIIFTSEYFKKTLLQKQKNTTKILITKNTFNLINDSFYNLGGVWDNLNDIMFFIKSFNSKLENLKFNRKEIKNTNDIDYSNCFVFEYVDNIDKLILPSIFNELDELTNLNDNEIDEFNRFFIENHYIKNYDNLMLPLLEFTHVPYEIISKFWIRSYTIESTFYKKLNNQLMLNSFEDYSPFVKMMYKGLQLKSFNLCCNCELFRIALVNKYEIDLLKDYFKKKVNNLPSSIFFCKAFLSFSKNKSKSLEFLTKNKNKINENKVPVLFIVNNFEKNFNFSEPLSSNADLSFLSFFPKEQEVLFFPFSSFTVEKLLDEKINDVNVKVIYLDYLGKYKNQIDEVLNEDSNIKNTIHQMIVNNESPFVKECVNFNLVPEIEKKFDKKLESKIVEIKKEKKNKFFNDSYSENEIIENIKIENFKEINNFEKLKCCIIILLNDKRICSSTNNSNIEIYNEISFKTEISIKAHKNNINHIFQAKNNNIISSSIDKTICITKIFPDNSYTIEQTLSSHLSYVFKCIELRDENLVSCSDDFSLIFWEKHKNYSKIYTYKNYNKIYDILEVKKNEIVLAQFYDKSLLFLNVNDKSSNKIVSNVDLTGWNNSLFMLNGTLIVGGHNFIYAVDVSKYEILGKHELKGNVWSVCKLTEFSVLSGDNYGNIIQWKISSNNVELVSEMKNVHDKLITSVVNLGENKIASCDGERIKIYLLSDFN